MWNTVLFDLDGTLTDSAEGITRCVKYALDEMGYDAPEAEELTTFVGPPLHEQFMNYAGFDSEQADRAVELYRVRFKEKGMLQENRLYPRVVKLLELLKQNGFTMGVASSKPEVYVREILEFFGISDYFKVIVGSELDGSRVEKIDVLKEAVRRLHMEKFLDKIVMVGDREFDIQGANELGISCIAAAYGYGSREELEKESPVYIAENVSDIAECLVVQRMNQKKEGPGRQLWRVLYPIAICYGAQILIFSIWSLSTAIYDFVVNGNTDVNAIQQKVVEQQPIIMAIASVVLLPLLYWLFKKDELRRKNEGIRKRMMIGGKYGAGSMAITAVFFVLCLTLLDQLAVKTGLYQWFPDYLNQIQSLSGEKNIVFSIVSIGIISPIVEELTFRGLVYRRLRDYIPKAGAVVLSAALFAVYHENLIQMLFGFLSGVLLVFLYERYKRMWAPVVAHMALNCFSLICNFSGINVTPDSTQIFLIFAGVELVIVAALASVIFKPEREKK